jgi:hypothetical protein
MRHHRSGTMAQRREVPPITRSGGTVDVRLPDGRTMSVPLSRTGGPLTGDVCCFCGEAVADEAGERLRIGARWGGDGDDHEQSWEAHRRCLRERMHERVRGQGPLFAE